MYIGATKRQQAFAYDIAKALDLALPKEKSVAAYDTFIDAHKAAFYRSRTGRNTRRKESTEKPALVNRKRQETATAVTLVQPRLYLKEVGALLSDTPIDKPEALIGFMAEQVKQADREYIYAVNLDGKLHPINMEEVAKGSLNGAVSSPREIFKSAVLSNAHAVMLFHNHLSKDPSPSAPDIEMTKEIAEAGRVLGIPLLDHVIIAGESYYSFHEFSRLV